MHRERDAGDFDIIGFSLPYEVLYTNMLEMLDLAGLPLLSKERNASHPLVIAGGHATFNPEPAADFVDAFIIGEGEEVIAEVVQAYQHTRGDDRDSQLTALAQIPGVYVPNLYDVDYNPDGTVASVGPNSDTVATPIATARCINPESIVTRTEMFLSTPGT